MVLAGLQQRRNVVTAPGAIKSRGLLSTGEVAEKMSVHRSTVWQWISSGALKAQKIGPKYMGIKPSDLAEFERRYVQDVGSTAASKPKKGRK